MNIDDFIKIYCTQYKILEDKIIDLSEYITIDPLNYPTFSLQLNTLFILICSELDSLAGEFCKIINEDEKNVHGIINKIDIIVTRFPNLRNCCVTTKYPYTKISLVPFTKFEANTHSWWSDYNDVKHNRSEKDENGRYNYQKANLKNILLSISALYVFIQKIGEEIYKEKFPFESRLFNDDIK